MSIGTPVIALNENQKTGQRWRLQIQNWCDVGKARGKWPRQTPARPSRAACAATRCQRAVARFNNSDARPTATRRAPPPQHAAPHIAPSRSHCCAFTTFHLASLVFLYLLCIGVPLALIRRVLCRVLCSVWRTFYKVCAAMHRVGDGVETAELLNVAGRGGS